MINLEKNKLFYKKIVLKVSKAILSGVLTYLIIYYPIIVLLPVFTEQFAFLNLEYGQPFNVFVIVVISLTIVSKLFSKTIFEYAFCIIKSTTIIVYSFFVFDGGIINLSVPLSDRTLDLVLDLRILLILFVFPNLLDIVKSFLEAINLLAKRIELDELSMN